MISINVILYRFGKEICYIHEKADIKEYFTPSLPQKIWDEY